MHCSISGRQWSGILISAAFFLDAGVEPLGGVDDKVGEPNEGETVEEESVELRDGESVEGGRFSTSLEGI